MNTSPDKTAGIEYGLIGEKLSHSFSQIIHNRLGDYKYQLIEIAPGELDRFMSARNFKGLNVTIPYKKAVIPYCDELSDAAKRIGSVNTLVIRCDGTLYGHNTDYDGFVYAASSASISFSGKKAIILGSGGTSLTAYAAIKDLGASEIVTVSRDGEVNYENVYEHIDAGIVVNTTPVGMYPNSGASLLDLARFPNLSGVIDVIYNPLRTALLLQAEKLHIPCTSGLPMLVAQAKAASELFISKAISDDVTDQIYRVLLGKVTNIVLIGMPGSGKTTIGGEVASRLGRKFVDTDEMIVENAGMSIPEIFERFGEPRFRELERAAVNEVSKEKGLVIAVGGGAVMNIQNRDALKQNGRIYYITQKLEALDTKGRPLSKSLDALKEIEKVRAPVYMALSDKTVPNDGSLNEAVELIARDLYENFGD